MNINPLLTDYYQLSMVYAYWRSGRTDEIATFEMFFRKNPFKGEYTVFAGLGEAIDFIKNFKFTDEIIKDLDTVFSAEYKEKFYEYLKSLDCSNLKIHAIEEGRIVFPQTPLITITGPLPIVQLLETTVLNLCNFASLIATNASRMRLLEPNKQLFEFGLRRAQGPNGALTATKYSYLGGFDGTSNIQSAIINNIRCVGTHAHSFVNSHTKKDRERVKSLTLKNENLWNLADRYRKENEWTNTNENELLAFISYAYAFPDNALMLVDTYNTLTSGIPNFLVVALTLNSLGYKPLGVRLDSGDLAYLSKKVRQMFIKISEKYNIPEFKDLKIVASNDIDENVLRSLNEQNHEIDAFGIGTNLVTCKDQPALGMVYKMVEINNTPTMKLSEQIEKINIPGEKRVYRLYDKMNIPIVDLMLCVDECKPEIMKPIICRHPFLEMKKMIVVPTRIEELSVDIDLTSFKDDNINVKRDRCIKDMSTIRNDHKRSINPSKYKVSVSENLYSLMHSLIEKEAPIPVIN